MKYKILLLPEIGSGKVDSINLGIYLSSFMIELGNIGSSRKVAVSLSRSTTLSQE